jgi:hypothetical protein
MQVEAAGSFIVAKLEKELPGYLSYHNVAHTNNVLKHTLEIAASEGIEGEDLDLPRFFMMQALLKNIPGTKKFPAKWRESSFRSSAIPMFR